MAFAFLKKKAIGLEISQAGIGCALVNGSPAHPQLESIAFRPFSPDMFRFSHRDLHIQDPQLFVERIKEATTGLPLRDSRVSLVVPDATGRIMLLDLEERWKSKDEAADMIRWKLKKSLPLELSDLHLDFQVLERREEGETAVMAAIVSRRVVQQYEELLEQAGLQADRIDFTTLNLLRCFEQLVAKDPNATFFSFYDQSLGVMIHADGVPAFYRSKILPGAIAGDNRLYMEVNSSLGAYRQRWPERVPGSIFCLAPPEHLADFCSMAAEVSGQECTALEVRTVITPSNGAPADQALLYPLTAAIGAAIGRL